VALKRIKIEKEDDGMPSTAIREIALLKKLKHPNVVELKDVVHEKDNLNLIFEYCEHGDLKQYMQSKGGSLTQREIKKLLY